MDKKYKYVAYAQMKDELQTLDTWIEHYFMLGFDHLYIVDDLSQIPIIDVLKEKKVNLSKISVISIDFTYNQFEDETIFSTFTLYDKHLYQKYKYSKQVYILNIFKKLYQHQFEWIFICDADEFLYLRDHHTIQEYFTKYINNSHTIQHIGQISFLWCMYGTSYNVYHPNGHLFQNFILSDKYLFTWTKSIVNINYVDTLHHHQSTLNNIQYNTYVPYYSGLINIQEFNQKHYKLNNSESTKKYFIDSTENSHKYIKYECVDAFCSHYITQDCYTFTKRKIFKMRTDYNLCRKTDDEYLLYVNNFNKIVNNSMLKYISNTNIEVKLYGISEKKYINILKYNDIYNTSCSNIQELLVHFYNNKTQIIYSNTNECIKYLNLTNYRYLYPNTSHLTDSQLLEYYIYIGLECGKIMMPILENEYLLPIDFDVKEYKYLNPDLNEMSIYDAKKHYLTYGITEKRQYKLMADNHLSNKDNDLSDFDTKILFNVNINIKT